MERLRPLIELEKISQTDAEKLLYLIPDSFCLHRSWGYGKVKKWDLVSEGVTVDFESKAGHVMQFEFAAQSLTPLSAEHIYSLKRTDLERVKKMAQEEPLVLIELVIKSLASGATSSGIEKMLSPDVIPSAGWKKWWESTRRAMKKEDRFMVPLSKTTPLKVLETSQNKKITLSEATEVKGLLPQLDAAEALLLQAAKLKQDKGTLEIFIRLIESSLRKITASQKGQALKLVLVRDELVKVAGIEPGIPTIQIIHEVERDLGSFLAGLSTERQTAVLRTIKEAEPYTWAAAVLKLLNVASARLAGVIRDFFKQENQWDVFLEGVKRSAREQSLSSEVLGWILKNRKGDFKTLIEPRLFNTLIAAIEQDQIGERKSAKLRDLVLSDKTLLTDLVKEADSDAVRDVTRGLLLTAVFDEMDKRSLLARLIKLYPEVQDIVNSASQKGRAAARAKEEAELAAAHEALIVSWESLEKRKLELDDLIQKKIPANTQEISVARSYGDLRENSEFKFAKEQQRVLSRRRAELEQEILRAKGTDFREVDASHVGIGTKVTLKSDEGIETYTILGAWDGEPEKKILSYLTPLAKALQGKQVGEKASIPGAEGHDKKITIQKIEPFIND